MKKIVFFLVIFTSAHLFSYEWKQNKKEENCISYFSAVEGKEYVASKVVCTVNAKLEVVGAIISDIENYSEWMDNCVATKILKVTNGNFRVFDFWYHQHVPILKDRDVILHSDTINELDKKQILINTFSIENLKYDSGKNVHRMKSFKSTYVLTYIDREHTQVEFMIDPDLGPGLPIGFSNSIIKDVPLASMQGLIKKSKTQKYMDLSKDNAYYLALQEAIKKGYIKN